MNVQIFDIMPVSWRLYSQIVIFCLLLAMGVYFVANRGKRRLHRLLGGVLLFWSLLHLKDMLLIDNAMPDRYLERLCICIDILAVPTCAFLLFELTAPGWFTWRRALRHELPFLGVLALFAFYPSDVVFHLDILGALAYSLWVITQLFHTIPAYNRTLRENFSNTENLDLEWLWKLLVFFILFLSVWAYSALQVSIPADIIYNVASGFLWVVICYNIHRQQPLVLSDAPASQASDPQSEPVRPEFAAELERLFDERKIWLNPRLTIGEVAQRLGSNRTYLSDYLNHTLGTSFYEYVNDYRIRAVAERLGDPECQLTIEAIAESCGFNSLSTFRRFFIRRYGCTPTRYRIDRGCGKSTVPTA